MKLLPLKINKKDLEVSMALFYCEHQEVVEGVMVKFVKTEKKTFLHYMSVQRPIDKEVHYKSDSTPISTPSSKSDCPLMDTPMGTPIITTRFKSDGTPMSTPNFRSGCNAH